MPFNSLSANQPSLMVSRDEARLKIEAQVKAGRDIRSKTVDVTSNTDWQSFSSMVDRWDRFNRTLLERLFTSTELCNEYAISGPGIQVFRIRHEEYLWTLRFLDERCSLLESVVERLDLFPDPKGAREAHTSTRTFETEGSRKVFVVHGHDDGVREAVCRCLERLGLEAVVLHEQANSGQTIIEKFETHSIQSAFAVVLLTPDDEGRAKRGTGALCERARQNVILELGYFMGRLGRRNVCAIRKGDVEVPSDVFGVVWVPFDGSGAWRFSLGKELRDAGFSVDLNKL